MSAGGALLPVKGTALAQYPAGLIATHSRPTALLRMFYCGRDRVPGSRYVPIPFGEEVATKSGHHDETMALDGTVCTALGRLQTGEPHVENQSHTSVSRRCPCGTFEQETRWTFLERRANTWVSTTTSQQASKRPDAQHQNNARRDATRVLGSMRTYHKTWQDPATGQEIRRSHHAVRCQCTAQLRGVHPQQLPLVAIANQVRQQR